MIQFFDDDPDELARRQLLKDGFKKLAEKMQAQVDADDAERRQRARQRAQRFNAKIAEEDGFFVPAGGEIEVSPTLAAILGIKYDPDARAKGAPKDEGSEENP